MFKRIIQTIKMHFTQRKVEALRAEVDRTIAGEDWDDTGIDDEALRCVEAYWPSFKAGAAANLAFHRWSLTNMHVWAHHYSRERDRRRAQHKSAENLADELESVLDSIGC